MFVNINVEKIDYYSSRIISEIRRRLKNLHRNIRIGNRTTIESGCTIRSQYGGKIIIGNNCYISSGAQLLTHGGNIKIGNHCTINPYTIIYGQGGTIIGDNVRIAAHCVIVPANHIFTDITIPIYKQGLKKEGIVIEDDVWIGSGVKILDGVTIKRGCVIGANAVVTHSTNEYGVYVGIPAKIIKSRK